MHGFVIFPGWRTNEEQKIDDNFCSLLPREVVEKVTYSSLWINCPWICFKRRCMDSGTI